MRQTLNEKNTQVFNTHAGLGRASRTAIRFVSMSYMLGLFSATALCLTTVYMIVLPLTLFFGEQSDSEPDGESAEHSYI